MDKDKLPRLARIMADRGYLLLPLLAIIYVLTGTSLTTAYGAHRHAGGGDGRHIKTIFDAAMAATRGNSVKEVVRQSEMMRLTDHGRRWRLARAMCWR